MLRIYFTLLAVLCVLLPLSQTAPVMSYFNVSNKPIQPRIPEARKIIPLPYREPAPVYEVQEEDDLDIRSNDIDDSRPNYETRNNVIVNGKGRYEIKKAGADSRTYRPIKYGFINPKTRYYDPQAAYNYHKRYIYSNYVY